MKQIIILLFIVIIPSYLIAQESKWLEILTFIKSAHPYDLPEILAFAPEQYESQYGKWVESEVNSKS